MNVRKLLMTFSISDAEATIWPKLENHSFMFRNFIVNQNEKVLKLVFVGAIGANVQINCTHNYNTEFEDVQSITESAVEVSSVNSTPLRGTLTASKFIASAIPVFISTEYISYCRRQNPHSPSQYDINLSESSFFTPCTKTASVESRKSRALCAPGAVPSELHLQTRGNQFHKL